MARYRRTMLQPWQAGQAGKAETGGEGRRPAFALLLKSALNEMARQPA